MDQTVLASAAPTMPALLVERRLKRWLSHNVCRIAGVVGLLALWVVDASLWAPALTNGFWIIDSVKAFHIALTIAVAALILVVLWPQPSE